LPITKGITFADLMVRTAFSDWHQSVKSVGAVSRKRGKIQTAWQRFDGHETRTIPLRIKRKLAPVLEWTESTDHSIFHLPFDHLQAGLV